MKQPKLSFGSSKIKQDRVLTVMKQSGGNKNENPPKSLTTGDNQLSIVGFNLIQRYIVNGKVGSSNRQGENSSDKWPICRIRSPAGLKLKIPRSTRLRGIIMSIVGFNLRQI
jgi:hypothetical protein